MNKFATILFLMFLSLTLTTFGYSESVLKEIPKYEADTVSGEWGVWRLPDADVASPQLEKMRQICQEDYKHFKFKPGESWEFRELTYHYVKESPAKDKLYLVFSYPMVTDALLVYVYSSKQEEMIGWFVTSPA